MTIAASIPSGVATAAPTTLPRRLGLFSLFLLIVAFNAPIAAMAGFMQLSIGFGNGLGAPSAFLVGGAILLTFSIGFVRMSEHIADPGSFYCFIIAGSGRSAGLAGSSLALTAYILLGAGAYPYMGIIITEFMQHVLGQTILNWQSWSLISLAFITFVGLFRVDLSMRFLGMLVCIEIVLVALWEAAIFWHGGKEGYALASFTPEAFFHGSAGLGVLFAMLCMIGIEAGACFSAETRNPRVTVARATFLSIAFLAIFYCLGCWCYIISQGSSRAVAQAVGNPVGSFFSSIRDYLGAIFVPMASLILLTSQLAALNSVQASASRYVFSLSRQGVLPVRFGRIHAKLESPYAAVILVGAICAAILFCIMALGLSPVTAYAGLTGMGIYFLVPLMIMTSFSILRFYLRNPGLAQSIWSSRIAPAMAAVMLLGLFVLTTFNLQTIVGSKAMSRASLVAVVLVPLAGWSLAEWMRRRHPDRYVRIGQTTQL